MAYFYFTIFTVLGALVLMTLFIGVITTSMEEAQEQNDKEKEDEDKVKEIVLEAGWGPKMVQQYKICFELLDLDGGGTIDQDELKEGLEKIGKSPGEDELEKLMSAADLDEEAGLDFPSFVRLMVDVTKDRRKKSGRGEGLSKGETPPSNNGDGSGIEMVEAVSICFMVLVKHQRSVLWSLGPLCLPYSFCFRFYWSIVLG